MSSRRRFLRAGAGLALAGAIPLARGQTAGRQRRIGYVALNPILDVPSPERAAFVGRLRELGYVEGRNLEIVYRSAQFEPEMLPDVIAELVQRHVELIAVTGEPVAVAAKKVTRSVPILLMGIGDPQYRDIVRDLAHPEANVTGTAWQMRELTGKRLELLKEAVPRTARVALVRNAGHSGARREVEVVKASAPRLGLRIDEAPLSDTEELPAVLQRVVQLRPDALMVATDPRAASLRTLIAEFAIAQRMPSVFGYRGFVEAGGLLSYAASLTEMYRRAADYAERLLSGAKPAELPVEQPTRFELVINARTAKAIGMTLPRPVLLRADEVIQ